MYYTKLTLETPTNQESLIQCNVFDNVQTCVGTNTVSSRHETLDCVVNDLKIHHSAMIENKNNNISPADLDVIPNF